MKATDLLRSQHDEMKTLLRQMRDADEAELPDLRRRCAAILRAHNTIEEELLYPRFEEREGFEDLVTSSYEQHEEAVSTLSELERLDVEDPEFEDYLDTLEQQVVEHVNTEEAELLPRVDKLWTRDMLAELGREMIRRFDELVGEEEEARV